MTWQERLDLAGAAVGRGRAAPAGAFQYALRQREFLRALEFTASRLQIQRPGEKQTRTVVQTMVSEARPMAQQPERLKNDTSPAIVIEAAQRLYGIDPSNYAIGRGADGGPRILHQDKQYNLGDFFTKHLQRPWPEAQQVLKDCYQATLSDALPPPDRALWRQFSQWRTDELRRLAKERDQRNTEFRSRVLKTRHDYKERKQAAQRLPGLRRVTAVATARAELLLAQQAIAQERKEKREKGRVPNRNAHYRQFLTALASRGETSALKELRRMAQPGPEDDDPTVTGRRSQAVFPLPHYTVDPRGGVTYKLGEEAIVRDAAAGVAVLKAEQAAYDAALRVAIARYGRTLTLRGDDKFIARMVEAARRSGQEVTIRDANRPRSQPITISARSQDR